MLVFVLISLLSLLASLLAFLPLSFGVAWLLPLSLVPCLPMKVNLTLSAQLGACAMTHAPAPVRLKKNRRKPVLFLFPRPPRPRPAGLQTVCRLSLGALIFVAPAALGRPFLLSLPLQTECVCSSSLLPVGK